MLRGLLPGPSKEPSHAQGTTPTLTEALAATTADYGTYVATRFKDRAKLIAAEIAQNRPVLVGLQEVATWHIGCVPCSGAGQNDRSEIGHSSPPQLAT